MSNRTGVPRTVLTPALRAAVLAAVREGISGQLIADSFGICRSSVSNIAREAGIRRGVKVPRVPDERRAEITARYMAGDGSEDLATEYGTTSATVRRIVLGSGGSTRPLGRVQRPLRHDAFDVLTPEASYWLGMMFTDGTIDRHSTGQSEIALGLKACDRGHLVKFRDFLGSEHAIIERPPKRGLFGMSGVQYRYSVRSQPLSDRVDTLGRYGPAPDPELAASPDFWRGVIDGDGTVGVYSGSPTVKVFGSDWLLGAFVEFLDSVGLRRARYGRPVNVRPCHGIFAVGTSGTTALGITRLLYADAPVALDRKAVRAEQIIPMEPPFVWACHRRSRGLIKD